MSLFTINSRLCKRDGICVQECPLGIIEIRKKGDFPSPVEKAEEICIRCGHCVAVCPAGEEVRSLYLQNKAAYIQQVLKPLQDRAEPVYVIAGSKAELAARRNTKKQIKTVNR